MVSFLLIEEINDMKLINCSKPKQTKAARTYGIEQTPCNSNNRRIRNAIHTGIWIFVCALLASLLSHTLDAGTSVPADFTITTSVAAPYPEPFGVNLGGRFLNNWTADPGMEPVVIRAKGVATGGGADYIENIGDPSTSYDGAIGDGFFNGAHVRVYRYVDGSMTRIRTGTVASYLASATSGFRIVLSETGSEIQAGDLYFVDVEHDNVPFGSLGTATVDNVSASDTWMTVGPIELFRDRSTVAPENGGKTSLRMSTTLPEFVGIAQAGYGSPETYLESLEPGHTYQVEVWLRQEGLSDGQVGFSIEGAYTGIEHTFTGVNSSWQKFSFTFIAPPRPPLGSDMALHFLAFNGPGTVWVDNFLIYDTALEPLAFMPEVQNALAGFGGGPLRIWSGHSNEQLGTNLDDWTNSDLLALRQYHLYEGAGVPDFSFKLPVALPLCRDVGSSPWLVVGPYFAEEEWLGLVEYLVGPAGTTYGDKRIAQGQVAPWTDEFDRIRIEIGNESWNGFFAWNFTAENHGRLSELIIRTVQSSPYYPAIADKLEFIVNGWILSPGTEEYGAVALQESPSADTVDVAAYIGGWETESQVGGTEVTDQGFQDFMLFSPSFIKYFTDRHADTRDYFASISRNYSLAVYEGGAGYPLPNPGAVENEVAEAYGKSLAAGVATLDMYLYFALRGYGPMCLFEFNTGPNYSSHTMRSVGFRPHVNWLALQMANRYSSGDMLVTSVNSAPAVDVPATDDTPEITGVPLVASYARRDGSTYSVFVLSREIDTATPVTLRLPFDSITTMTRYELSGDPRSSNRDAMLVDILSSSVSDFSPTYQFSMPAGSVYLFVFEGATTATESNPSALVSLAPGQIRETTDQVVQFSVNFSQPVVGFEAEDVLIEGTTGAAVVQIFDAEPYTGNNYGVLVSGMVESGTLSISVPAGAAINGGGIANTSSESLNSTVQYTHSVIVPSVPEFTAPVPGSVLPELAVTFEWSSNGLAVDHWYLDVGSYLDGSDIFTGGFAPEAMWQVVSPLPSDGREVFARLWYLIGEDWAFIDAQYTAHTAVFDSATPPGLIAPTALTGAEATFEWAANGYPVEQWFIDIGTFLDGSDIYAGAFDPEVTSEAVSGIPTDGREVFVRLWHRLGWDWFYQDYQF